MKICIAAYENKTELAAMLCAEYCAALCRHRVYATGSLASYISEEAGFDVNELMGLRSGGLQQIAQMASCRDADMVICLRDPAPGAGDGEAVAELSRVCDFYGVPFASGLASARILLHSLQNKKHLG